MLTAKLTDLSRMRCMCGSDDRQCPHCGWPFEAQGPHSHEDGPATEGEVLATCPRCGCPTTKQARVSLSASEKLRKERGLIP